MLGNKELENRRGQVSITSVNIEGPQFFLRSCVCLYLLVFYLNVSHAILSQEDLRILWLLGQMCKSTCELFLWGSCVEDLIYNAVVFKGLES